MQRINVATFCQAARVTRSDGARLRQEIEKHFGDAEPLLLDFSGVRIASVSFFDESLGLLAREHSLDELRARVRVEGMDPSDRELLNRIVTSRSRERDVSASESPDAAGS